MNIVSILLGIVAIGIIALTHELGHYFMAKRAKINVEELSIGVGPKLVSFKKKNTQYSIRILPFFAYVKLADEGKGSVKEASAIKRFNLFIGGVLFNFILGILIFTIIGTVSGFVTNKILVGEISPNSPALVSGLVEGDQILAFNEDTLESPEALINLIQENGAKTGVLEVSRNEKLLQVEITPELNKETNKYVLGIYFGREKMGLISSVGFAFKTTYETIAGIFAGLGTMLVGKGAADVAGPIGVVTMAGAFTTRVGDYFLFIAILSISMGVFNLLPIPALDGGKIAFLAWETITRKKINEKVELYATLVGFGLLILFLIFATFKDIVRIMGG